MQGQNGLFYRSYFFIVDDLRKVRNDSMRVRRESHPQTRTGNGRCVFCVGVGLAEISLMIYNRVIKVFFTLAIYFLMLFCTHLAMAKDKVSPHADANECSLKNKVFCGGWADQQGFEWDIDDLSAKAIIPNAK